MSELHHHTPDFSSIALKLPRNHGGIILKGCTESSQREEKLCRCGSNAVTPRQIWRNHGKLRLRERIEKRAASAALLLD
jgi:hypothetical protein